MFETSCDTILSTVPAEARLEFPPNTYVIQQKCDYQENQNKIKVVPPKPKENNCFCNLTSRKPKQNQSCAAKTQGKQLILQSYIKKTKAKSKLRTQNLRKTLVLAILQQENQSKIKVVQPKLKENIGFQQPRIHISTILNTFHKPITFLFKSLMNLLPDCFNSHGLIFDYPDHPS